MVDSFVQRRLKKIKANKAKVKKALATLPAIPSAPLPYRLIQQGGPAFVDAASIAFQNEILIRRLAEAENQLQRNREMAGDVQPLSITDSLMRSVPEVVVPGEEILQTLSDEELADTELIDALLDDIKTGREVIRESRQFSRANLLGGIDLSKPKRTRKKTKTDKKMSKALRLANERFRKKNGQLRKGATQSKIMKYAHKLLRKM